MYFQDQIAYLCLQARLLGNQIICGFAGCPLPLGLCLYPITTIGLFVSAFPCSRTPLCSPSGGGRAAFETVCLASRAPARSLAARRGEVWRALSTGCCHLSASLKRYVPNLISRPKNRPGSCKHSRRPQGGEMHLGKLLPAGFLTTLTRKPGATGRGVLFARYFSLTGHWWHFCHTCFPPLSPNTGDSDFSFSIEVEFPPP